MFEALSSGIHILMHSCDVAQHLDVSQTLRKRIKETISHHHRPKLSDIHNETGVEK